jgi:hypothetical protein
VSKEVYVLEYGAMEKVTAVKGPLGKNYARGH